MDWASHQVTSGTGKSPYTSSTRREYVSAIESREDVAGTYSAADSGTPSWGRHTATSRQFVPQANASKSSRPAVDDDAEQVARYQTGPVCAPH